MRNPSRASVVMELELDRVFDQHGAETVVIDPAVDNRRATRRSGMPVASRQNDRRARRPSRSCPVGDAYGL